MPSAIELKITFDQKTHNYRQLKAEVIALFERQFVEWVLQQFDGNLSEAARNLKMDRKHLHDICTKHGLR